jgi:hypothetical protein
MTITGGRGCCLTGDTLKIDTERETGLLRFSRNDAACKFDLFSDINNVGFIIRHCERSEAILNVNHQSVIASEAKQSLTSTTNASLRAKRSNTSYHKPDSTSRTLLQQNFPVHNDPGNRVYSIMPD